MPFPSAEDASGIWSLRDVLKYKETGAWPDTKLEVQYVVVGGGGGGGVIGGGGGGGGVRMSFNTPPISQNWPFGEQREPRMFLAPGNYPVIVGIGGNSGQQYTPATNGGDSSFNGIVGFGGGGGGNHVTATARQSNKGKDGGSGGGGSDNSTAGGATLHRRNPGYQAAPKFYVNDFTLGYATRASFPVTGSSFYLYLYRANDTQKLYVWNGTTYIETAPININYVPRSSGWHGSEGRTGAYLYPTTGRYGGGGGGAFSTVSSGWSSGGGGPERGGRPAAWGYSDTNVTSSYIQLGGGGGGGGYVSTTGGASSGGGGGSVNSGTAGIAYWMNNNGYISSSITGTGQVGDNLIGGYGQPNRGGGGGGCSWVNPPITRHGGSGVVIIRYHGLQQATGGEIQTSTGLFRTGWTTHVFNSSGVFTVTSTANTGRLVVPETPTELYGQVQNVIY